MFNNFQTNCLRKSTMQIHFNWIEIFLTVLQYSGKSCSQLSKYLSKNFPSLVKHWQNKRQLFHFGNNFTHTLWMDKHKSYYTSGRRIIFGVRWHQKFEKPWSRASWNIHDLVFHPSTEYCIPLVILLSTRFIYNRPLWKKNEI